VLAALGRGATEVRLRAPMTEAETAAYVARRLELGRAGPAVRARFGRRELARLHALSGGVPRRVHELAARLLRGEARWDADDAGAEELDLSAPDADEALEV